MSQSIDLVYDRLVAEEKHKSGSKYERLAAIVFRALTGNTTVHDLRLRGESGVAHQIDAVVGPDSRRILIEAKDYDKPVGLPIVRNFSAVIDDIEPDDAYIVTTERFTRDAVKFAKAKGIQLAMLRPMRDEDWENLVRRVKLTIRMTSVTGPPNVTWQLHPDDVVKLADADGARGLTDINAIELGDANGQRQPFKPILDQQLEEEPKSVPPGGEGVVGRTVQVSEPTWLCIPRLPPLRVAAWRWEAEWRTSDPHELLMGEGIAGLAAELVLKTVDGTLHRVFTNRDIQQWTFDGKTVAPRTA
jgi:hypothetical protein